MRNLSDRLSLYGFEKGTETLSALGISLRYALYDTLRWNSFYFLLKIRVSTAKSQRIQRFEILCPLISEPVCKKAQCSNVFATVPV